MTEKETKLWNAYWQNRTVENRNRLVELYLPLARAAASSEVENFGYHVPVEDLESDAYLALLECVERYRADAGASFKTFARRTIHYRTLDEVRARDIVSRKYRERSTAIVNAQNEFFAEHGRPIANDADLAVALGMTQNNLARLKKYSKYMRIHSTVSLNAAHEGESKLSAKLTANGMNPADAAALRDYESVFVYCSALERAVMLLPAFLNWELDEVARRLRVNVGRVHYLRRRAIENVLTQ